MIHGIDHLVILVDDLETGIQQYRDLGFTVTPGGKHPRGTHNALVSFGDGSYLELIAFWEPDYTEHRWHRFISLGGGLIDHALGTDDLEAEVAAAGERNVRYSGPHDGARTRPDGVELVWKTATPESGQALPFLIEDVTDRALRVPGGEAARHANGVLGIESLIIAVADLEKAGQPYTMLLQMDPVPLDETGREDSVSAVALQAGAHRVELHQPRPGGPMDEQVQRRGDGPYAAVFHGTETREIDPARAGGARISVIVR